MAGEKPVHLRHQTPFLKGVWLKLQSRNRLLWYFGWLNLAGCLASLLLWQTGHTEVMGISAWTKPLKFFLSIALLSFTMSWYLVYLERRTAATVYSRVLVITMTIEMIIICWQAAHGRMSHFNVSTPENGLLFSVMGMSIAIFTGWTLYIALLFWRQRTFPPMLPDGYVWGIRLGLLFFVLFAAEGGQMAARLAHSVSGPDGEEGLPLLNWSTQYGDLRVAHFFGMHSLQLLPLLGYYIARTRGQLFLAAGTWLLFTGLLYWQALEGYPLI